MEESLDFDDYINHIETLSLKESSHVITYNKRNDYYNALRKSRIDPLLNIPLDICFEFKYKWDPYTGERLEEDINGPLCFHPDVLIHYFYTNRLNNLWIDSVDDSSGFYEGYYGCHVGAGSNLEVKSRGLHPEKYLLRLPIVDCYLTNDHKESIVTMGPILTDEEINIIDELAFQTNMYHSWFNKPKPSLSLINDFYRNAIDNSLEYNENIQGVDELRQL